MSDTTHFHCTSTKPTYGDSNMILQQVLCDIRYKWSNSCTKQALD